MKPAKATASILSLIASGSLGVDALVFDDTVLSPQTNIIAEERVEVRQVENIVEAKAPWKGEQGISIKYDMGEPSFTDRVKDRRKQEVIYEAVDFGDGGFKIDVLLTEKPPTNRFCYTIEGAENYDFFYQPPLTEQEKAEGSSRPPEIEGSYAVYHKTLKNHVLGQENYATGKVMHIPRPQVWELGNEEATKRWADLSYDAGQLCVTAPQDFIDNADYTNGVRIDPTFGYTTAGLSNQSVEERIVCTQHSLAQTGYVYAMSASVIISTSGHGFKYGIYDAAKTKISSTSQSTYSTASQGWHSIDGPNTLLPSGSYYLCALDGAIITSGDGSVYYDTGASTSFWKSTTPNIFFPQTVTGETSTTSVYSIYATYETQAPTVVTDRVDTNPESAIMRGTISQSFNASINRYGFAWGTDPSMAANTATITISDLGVLTASSSYSYVISGLERQGTYYARSFIESPWGTTTGSVVSFLTDTVNTLLINNGTIRINNGKLDL